MGKAGGGGGLFDSIHSNQTLHIVQLGLDSAGKTTVLYRLKFDQYLNTVPTIGFNCEKVRGTGKAKGVNFLVWDVGGQEKLRPLWRSYTRCTDGIVFVLDSVDVERMEEAKIELMRTVNSNVVSRPITTTGLMKVHYINILSRALRVFPCWCWRTSRTCPRPRIRRRSRNCSD